MNSNLPMLPSKQIESCLLLNEEEHKYLAEWGIQKTVCTLKKDLSSCHTISILFSFFLNICQIPTQRVEFQLI